MDQERAKEGSLNSPILIWHNKQTLSLQISSLSQHNWSMVCCWEMQLACKLLAVGSGWGGWRLSTQNFFVVEYKTLYSDCGLYTKFYVNLLAFAATGTKMSSPAEAFCWLWIGFWTEATRTSPSLCHPGERNSQGLMSPSQVKELARSCFVAFRKPADTIDRFRWLIPVAMQEAGFAGIVILF